MFAVVLAHFRVPGVCEHGPGGATALTPLYERAVRDALEPGDRQNHEDLWRWARDALPFRPGRFACPLSSQQIRMHDDRLYEPTSSGSWVPVLGWGVLFQRDSR